MFGFHHTHRSSANQRHWSIYLAEFKSIVISIHIFWKLLQEIFSGCIFSHQKFAFKMKKWKYDLEKKTLLIIGDQKSMINFYQFETLFWAKHSTQWKWNKILKIMSLVWKMSISWRKMLKNWTNVTNVTASSRADTLRTHLKMHSGEKSNKCNQCDYASSQAGHLRSHLKTHSDYASSRTGNLKTHLKTHSGEKSNKCNQCDFRSSEAGNLRKQ